MRAAIRCVLKVSDSVSKGGFVCSLKLVAEMLNHRLSMLFVQINPPIAQRDWRKLWQGNIYSFLRSLKRSCLMLQLIWKISLAAPLSGCGHNSELVTLIKENLNVNSAVKILNGILLHIVVEHFSVLLIHFVPVCHAINMADLHHVVLLS